MSRFDRGTGWIWGAIEGAIELHPFISPANPACPNLAQKECEASQLSGASLAWSEERTCAPEEPTEVPSLIEPGSSERVRPSSWTWTYSEERPDERHKFIELCTQAGWKVLEDTSDVRALTSERLAMPNCESTPPYMAVFGAPLGENWSSRGEYVGWRVGKNFDVHGSIMAYPCATETVGGCAANAPEKWYGFELSYVPGLWVSAQEPTCQGSSFVAGNQCITVYLAQAAGARPGVRCLGKSNGVGASPTWLRPLR